MQVVEELDGACQFENLRIYEFPPPTMQKVPPPPLVDMREEGWREERDACRRSDARGEVLTPKPNPGVGHTHAFNRRARSF